jgi:hypothetical protein
LSGSLLKIPDDISIGSYVGIKVTPHSLPPTMRGADKVFGFIKKTTSYGTEKMYLLYIFPPSSTHL